MKKKTVLAAAISGMMLAASGAAYAGQGQNDQNKQHAPKKMADKKGPGKGKNACKGKGGCKTDKHECAGKNDCKGQGGCDGAHGK